MAHSVPGLSIARAIQVYLNDCASRGESARTIELKTCSLGAFERWCQSHCLNDCTDIGEAQLEWYRSYTSQYVAPHRQKVLDIATQRNRLCAVKVFFRRLHYLHCISSNPAAFYELPSVPHRIPRAVLTVEEVECILAHTLLYGDKGLRDRAILETFYATGIRRMELGRLTVPDVDLGSGVLRIIAGKGQKDRRVPMARRTGVWIKRYLDEVRPGIAGSDSVSVLFLSMKGRSLTPAQLSRLGGKYIHRAGVNKPGACHLWRHSAATLMLENGAGLRQIQEMLGHASISTTQIYTHVTIKQLKEVYQRCHPAARDVAASETLPL